MGGGHRDGKQYIAIVLVSKKHLVADLNDNDFAYDKLYWIL
jgi:hypothetical protein